MKPHTPGPWRVDGVEVFGPDNKHIVWELSCTKADADLIAAAPDLLAALKGLIDTGLVREFDVPENHAALAAIAKAEGRDQ